MPQYDSITISGPDFLLNAFNSWDDIADPETDNLLIKLDGWDSANNKSFKTVQKGVGAGSYLVSIDIAETTITVEFQAHKEDSMVLRDLLRSIQKEMLKDSLLNVVVLRSDIAGEQQQLETLKCYLKGYAFPARSENDATVTLTLLCLNPEKEFELLDNGVSTIEKGL
jgi:hypothetical protein